MKKKNRLELGDWVEVHATVSFHYNEDATRDCFRKECNANKFIGRITGASNKPLGSYQKGGTSGGGWDGPPEYDPPYLAISRCVFVYKVRVGLMNKEMLVLPEDLRVLTPEESKDLKFPFKEECYFGITPDYRKVLSDFAKVQLRDKKGKFVSGGYQNTNGN